MMIRLGKDCLKCCGFSDVDRKSSVIDGADVVSSSTVFQTRRPATVKTLLPTVESLMGGTSRLLELLWYFFFKS